MNTNVKGCCKMKMKKWLLNRKMIKGSRVLCSHIDDYFNSFLIGRSTDSDAIGLLIGATVHMSHLRTFIDEYKKEGMDVSRLEWGLGCYIKILNRKEYVDCIANYCYVNALLAEGWFTEYNETYIKSKLK